jgi:hypothetical protein
MQHAQVLLVTIISTTVAAAEFSNTGGPKSFITRNREQVPSAFLPQNLGHYNKSQCHFSIIFWYFV